MKAATQARIDDSPLAWLDAVQRQRHEAGLRRCLRPRPAVATELDLASNDYLGLSRHPAVIDGGVQALRIWGAGATGSRLVTGDTKLHQQFEAELAEFVGAAAGLLFSSGYTANLGAVVGLSGPGSLLVSDARSHASLVDACRLSRARVVVTPHRDVDAVDAALRSRDELAAGPASRVAILLPAHWQTAAVLFGVWWIGAQAILDDSPADVALCTADRLAEADAVVNSAAVAGEVAVLSLDPFGRPATGLPVGVTDYATAVRVHGDQIVPEHNPGPVLAGRSVEQILRDCAASAAARGLTAADRVLSTASWAGPDELVDGLLAILAAGASLVQVANPDPAMLQRRIATEKVTRVL